MNSAEIIKKLCKEKKISISKLESDLGFGNGYIGKKKGMFPADRLKMIANYLGVPERFLMGEESVLQPLELTPEPTETLSNIEYEIVMAYRRADDVTREMVLRVLRIDADTLQRDRIFENIYNELKDANIQLRAAHSRTDTASSDQDRMDDIRKMQEEF